MPTFYYQARNNDNQPERGAIEASDLQDAIAQVVGRGWSLESIGTVAPASYAPEPIEPVSSESATNADVMRRVFRSHLENILHRARPIVPALKAFSDEPAAKRLRGELNRLISVIERGDSAQAEKEFVMLPDYWIPLISSAMTSDDPGRILQEYLKESQRSDEVRRQWQLTLAYPIVVGCLALIVMVFLSVFVVPIFRAIFSDFGLTLPGITLINLEITSWISHWWGYLTVAAVLLIGFAVILSFRSVGRVAHGIFGRLLIGRNAAVARLSQLTADLLDAGISTPDALQVAGFLTPRKNYRQALWRLADEQKSNAGVATFSVPRRLATITFALRADLPSQSRVRLLREINEANLERSRRRLSWTRGLIEPVSIILIGLMVGVVVISLFLPLLRLINGLSS
jgi:type II secretory pathway component PulF